MQNQARMTLVTLLFTAAIAVQASEPEALRVAVPAQPIAAAINELSRQSGLRIVIDSRLAQGVVSNKVEGTLTAEAALAKLLENTGLGYEYLGENAVAVVKKNKPIAAAAGSREMRLTQAGSVAGTSSAARQDSPAGQDNAGSTEKASGTKLDEIIVTATKRSQNVRDVPVSISVLTSDDIERRGLVDAEDYLRSIPGVNQMEGAQGQTIVIRGIESSVHDPNAFAGTTVATYFGETPTTNTAGLGQGSAVDIKLIDIERVEVLRGPQGTAFGNSSLGGAVRTIPVAPKLDRFEGKIGAGYSSTSGTGGDNYALQAIANVPLVRDKLALRGVAYKFQDSGYYRNRAASTPAFRASVVDRYGAQAYATDDEDMGSYDVTGGRISALFQATEDLSLTLTYLSQKAETTGWALANSGTWEQTLLRVAPEHRVRGESVPISDLDIDLANAVVQYDLGWGRLTATYSHIDSGGTYTYSGTTYPLIALPTSLGNPSDHSENVGELRLATQFSGAWNFLAGLYAEKVEDSSYYSLYWIGDPALDIYVPGARFLGDSLEQRDQKQKAAFAEVSWQFLPHWTLTGGARAYDYERVSKRDTSGPFYGVSSTSIDADASGTTFRGNLSYKPTDTALMYATWSQGFRLGRPQPGLPAGTCDPNGDGIVDGVPGLTIASTMATQSDEVDNYELGAKFVFADRRLAIAADVFRIDWTGIPVTAQVITGLCRSSYNANAGEARSEGVELEVNFQVTEAVRIDAGASHIKGELTRDAPGLGARAGAQLPGSPGTNANLGIQYEFQLGGHAAYVRADSMYSDFFYGDLLQSPTTKAGGYLKLDTSARVTIRDIDIDLFVRNVTDEDASTYRGAFNVGPLFSYRLRPRTVGVQFSYDF